MGEGNCPELGPGSWSLLTCPLTPPWGPTFLFFRVVLLESKLPFAAHTPRLALITQEVQFHSRPPTPRITPWGAAIPLLPRGHRRNPPLALVYTALILYLLDARHPGPPGRHHEQSPPANRPG